ERTRGDPLAQALPRTPPLPTARDNDDPNLTLIEASFTHILMGRQMPSRGRRHSARASDPTSFFANGVPVTIARAQPRHCYTLGQSPIAKPLGCSYSTIRADHARREAAHTAA